MLVHMHVLLINVEQWITVFQQERVDWEFKDETIPLFLGMIFSFAHILYVNFDNSSYPGYWLSIVV